jgi:hypothetical protein
VKDENLLKRQANVEQAPFVRAEKSVNWTLAAAGRRSRVAGLEPGGSSVPIIHNEEWVLT